MGSVCPRCGSETANDARFCSSCGAPLEPLQDAERKLATIVFADLVGSTELAAGRDPEDLRRRLAPFFDLARSTLTEHGGTIEKYIGDAVMAVFGVPVAHGDDPDRAVAAGLELSARIASTGDGLAVRIGIETGEVLALDGGRDLSVTGDAVNAAARLQAAAAPGEVLVGERTARSSRTAKLEAHDAVEAKGFPGPLAAFRALAVSSAAPLSASPFVGREDDLELLRIAYRRAVGQRTPELVTVTGEAGIGKTRLANELFTELAGGSDPPRVLLGRNPPYGRGIAFWALGEILREAACSTSEASVEQVRAALTERLAALGADDARELAATLAVALGGAGGNGDGADIGDALKRAWRRLVALLAAEGPLVIGIDDAHWADEAFLDLVEDVALGLDEAPTLILCTSRPELVERRPGFGRTAPNVTRIELRPLPAQAATELSVALLPERLRTLAARVAEASGGNPFFAEEVACRILEDPGAALTDLPETVQAATAARLDRLPPAEKRVIQHAAVLGPGFRAEALADLLGEPPGAALDALVAKALVQERLVEGPGRYAFRHMLIRDVAYASLPRQTRAALHERAAALLARTGERHSELVELIAFHRVQAAELEPSQERRQRAYSASREAAEIVARRGASLRAQHLLEQAAELAGSDADRLDSLRSAANVAVRGFRGDEALRLCREEAAAAEALGDTDAAASAYAQAVQIGARMGGVTGYVPEVELTAMQRRGHELVAEDDLHTRARLLLNDAWIAWRFDRMDNIPEPAQAGLELAREIGDPALVSNALDAVSAVAWTEGRYEFAVTNAQERLELIDGVEAPTYELEFERSDALHMLNQTLVQTGRFREAAAAAAQARDADLALGIPHSAWERGLLPSFYLGDWDEVLTMASEARAAWTAAGRPPIGAMATPFASPGAILGYRGREDDAADWFEFARALAPGDSKHDAGIGQFEADVLLHRGQVEEAADLLEPAEASWSWSGPTFAAVRAEALVRAGRRSDDAIAIAERATTEHPFGRATALRARGQRDGDESLMRQALAIFVEIECPYQEARTSWLLGERPAAGRIFEGLGVDPPT
jgi:class 3 adenylate cyclase/tetratricopeptide (TPR) repeat protein